MCCVGKFDEFVKGFEFWIVGDYIGRMVVGLVVKDVVDLDIVVVDVFYFVD